MTSRVWIFHARVLVDVAKAIFKLRPIFVIELENQGFFFVWKVINFSV